MFKPIREKMIWETFQIYFMVRLKDFSLDEKELKEQLWFLGWSKILSDRSKNNCIYIIYSCNLIIHYSLFLNNHFTEPIISDRSCAPAWYGEQDESHPHFILYWKLP